MSILTICFHAVNLSMRMSEGLSSCGAVFFLIWGSAAVGSCRGRRGMVAALREAESRREGGGKRWDDVRETGCGRWWTRPWTRSGTACRNDSWCVRWCVSTMARRWGGVAENEVVV